jgi:hypothetical protein
MAASIGAQRPRGAFLTVMAILFVILAISDFTKALQFISRGGGLVVLGHKLQGVAINAVAGPLFGIFLLTYAAGLWRMRAWVLPMAMAYAFYVPVNLVMFWYLHTDPRPPVTFIAVYLFISLVGSVGTGLYLAYHRDQLT